MKYLFIGGPSDGQRVIVLDSRETVYVHAMSERPFSMEGDTIETSYTYRRFRFGKHVVYLYSRMGADEALETLIRRYPQPLK